MKKFRVIKLTVSLVLASNLALSQNNGVEADKADYISDEGSRSGTLITESKSDEVVNSKLPLSSYFVNNTKSEGGGSYTTSIGIRGGFTSGISLKHFIKSDAALEFVVGSRWRGLSISGLYEWHKRNAFDVPELTWQYGVGARIGFYRGRYYYGSTAGNCQDPNNPKCYNYWNDNRNLTAFGVVGIGGLEYKFNEVPFTVSLDLMPYIYFNHWEGGNFIDGSLSIRYILK